MWCERSVELVVTFVLELEETATAICVPEPDNTDNGVGGHRETLHWGKKEFKDWEICEGTDEGRPTGLGTYYIGTAF
jgi:hypothetical protein